MTTAAKIASNRRNAKRSTGPKSPSSKAKSSKNALRHGLLAKEAVLPDEDAAVFAAFRDELRAEYDPHGVIEGLLVDEIAMCAWRLRRCHRVEVSMFVMRMAANRASRTQCLMNNVLDRVPPVFDESLIKLHDRARLAENERDAEELGGAFVCDSNEGDAFSKLSRYEVTLQRRLVRAMHELERLQAARAGQSVSRPVAVDIDVRADRGN